VAVGERVYAVGAPEGLERTLSEGLVSGLRHSPDKERVQPRLVRLTVPTIMKAIDISEPYALRIRNGNHIPHPRHWLNLARLVGILGLN
jgi:S1-C subfamily serine protease